MDKAMYAAGACRKALLSPNPPQVEAFKFEIDFKNKIRRLKFN